MRRLKICLFYSYTYTYTSTHLLLLLLLRHVCGCGRTTKISVQRPRARAFVVSKPLPLPLDFGLAPGHRRKASASPSPSPSPSPSAFGLRGRAWRVAGSPIIAQIPIFLCDHIGWGVGAGSIYTYTLRAIRATGLRLRATGPIPLFMVSPPLELECIILSV